MTPPIQLSNQQLTFVVRKWKGVDFFLLMTPHSRQAAELPYTHSLGVTYSHPPTHIEVQLYCAAQSQHEF